LVEDFLPSLTQVPIYFQKRSELRRYKVAIIAVAVMGTCAAVFAGVGSSLNGAEYLAVAIGSFLLYLLIFGLIMIPANRILIQILGRKQLREEKRNIARDIINDFFDGKEIVLPNADDNLVKAEAVVMFREYFQEQKSL
jgi:hypothetical protein